MIINQKVMNRIIYWMTLFMLVCQFLIYNIGFSTYIMIVLDLFLVLGTLFCFRNFISGVYRTGSGLTFLVVLLLFGFAVFGCIWNQSSISLYLLGVYRYGKYFLLFFLCAFIFTREGILKLFGLLNIVLWLNVIMCTIQYFVLGYKGDFCGGLFGTSNTNGWMNIFLCLICAYVLSCYACGLANIKKVVSVCLPCIYISALAEIKFFFFELAIIFLLILMFSRPTKRRIALGIAGVVLLLALSQVVELLWSSSSSSVFSLEGILYYFEEKDYGYASAGDLGRIGGIAKLNRMFFGDEYSFFGHGLGMCGYGTEFYKMHGELHYVWFGYLLTYIETGWSGLVLHVAFFVSVLIGTRKIRKLDEGKDPIDTSLYLVAECMAILGIILLWYNTTVKNYPAYFLFMSLAFPFALCGKKNLRRTKQEMTM